MTEPWPYSLPIFRRAHRATSPDGRFVAEMDPAWEVSMSNPTSGVLRVSSGLAVERCNPSFIWSDDSRYLAVPKYFNRLGLLRKQRVLIIDVIEGRVFASRMTASYFQPESFVRGTLVITQEPFGAATQVTWHIPDDLAEFRPFTVDGRE